MGAEDDGWSAYQIAEAGITVDRYRPWPIETTPVEADVHVYQRLPEGAGLLFVQYGPGETADDFLATLGDLFTQVTLLEDQPSQVAGQAARRIVARLERQGRTVYRIQPSRGPVDQHLPAVSTYVEAMSFQHRGVPIVVGCRVEEARRAVYWPLVKHFLGSVRVLE